MQVVKIKYSLNDSSEFEIIYNYLKQYNSVLHFVYNRYKDNCTQATIRQSLKSLNNIELIGSWFQQSAFYDAKELLSKDKIIFGGKSNFFKRLNNKISKEEFKIKRLRPLYSIGEIVNKCVKANRYFHIEQDLETILFKPDKSTRIFLNLIGLGKRKTILKTLYKKQEQHQIKITYKLDLNYVYICFDETEVQNYKTEQIENRIFSIDLNPNYIGWSIIDWKSSSDFSLIKSGIISIKQINDKDFNLNGRGHSLDSKERIYISNKRTYEIFDISKNLINKAIYYKCSLFVVENLDIKISDKGAGKHFNKLINTCWNRNKLINNLQKRCNIFNIKFLKVKPEYSSFIGNFLYRDLNLPDMILSSIEISRRGYEFYNQYITKTKDIKKNIVQPFISDFKDRFLKSLEEFKISGEFKDFVELYNFFKKSKIMYRLSLDKFDNLKFSRQFSKASLILKCNKF